MGIAGAFNPLGAYRNSGEVNTHPVGFPIASRRKIWEAFVA